MEKTLEAQKVSIIEKIISTNNAQKLDEIAYITSLIASSDEIVLKQEDLETQITKARQSVAEGRVFSSEQVKDLAKTWGR